MAQPIVNNGIARMTPIDQISCRNYAVDPEALERLRADTR